MSKHSRNQGSTSVDAILLFGMSGAIVVLVGVIWYLAELTTAAMNAG